MGKHSIVVCNYLSDNDRFAKLVNASEFGGRPVLRGDMLESDDGRYAVLRPKRKQKGGKSQSEERFRDIKKRTKNGDWVVITAIENRENIDHTMPLRMLEYDLLEYNSQVREIEKNKAKFIREAGKVPCHWNVRLQKGDKLHPVHAICFYHGTDPWDGPRSLKDKLDELLNREEYQHLDRDTTETIAIITDNAN